MAFRKLSTLLALIGWGCAAQSPPGSERSIVGTKGEVAEGDPSPLVLIPQPDIEPSDLVERALDPSRTEGREMQAEGYGVSLVQSDNQLVRVHDGADCERSCSALGPYSFWSHYDGREVDCQAECLQSPGTFVRAAGQGHRLKATADRYSLTVLNIPPEAKPVPQLVLLREVDNAGATQFELVAIERGNVVHAQFSAVEVGAGGTVDVVYPDLGGASAEVRHSIGDLGSEQKYLVAVLPSPSSFTEAASELRSGASDVRYPYEIAIEK